MQESQQKSENQMRDLPDMPRSVFQDGNLQLYDEESQPAPRDRQRERGPRVAITSIVLLVVVLGGAAFFLLRPAPQTTPTYKNQSVVQGDLLLTVSATGPVQGTIYNADFVVTGRISEIDVSVGQQVKAGQLLAKLDPNTLPGGTNTSNATLTAPHAGTVTAINGAVGASSGAGATITHLIQIVDTSSLQVLANVDETDVARLAIGNAVQFTVGAYGNQQFQGTVAAIAPQGQTVSNVVTYPVTINVDMKSLQGANLLPSMTANVSITTDQRTNVLLIPNSAVDFAQTAASQGLVSSSQMAAALSQARQQLLDLQNTSGNGSGSARDNPSPAVVLSVSNGQLLPTAVVLGLTDGTMYEVLVGLSEGQTIATS
ncbi:MAG TPA: HlyD family efflux transporter periplasmic adaptor subunit [Ktedonobacteraceae bacterium]|nr:HlyD family efflux transporter periplasmic adaptor subunit [Ktedonobacteraceae bacterium]